MSCSKLLFFTLSVALLQNYYCYTGETQFIACVRMSGVAHGGNAPWEMLWEGSFGCTVPGCGCALVQWALLSLQQVGEVPDLQEQRAGVLWLWSWVSTRCNLTHRNEIHITLNSLHRLCGVKGDGL